jgi:hypothetical protein
MRFFQTIGTEQEVTILSGKAIQILTTRLAKTFLSHSDTKVS